MKQVSPRKGESYEGPSEASPGGLGRFPPRKRRITRRPERSEPGRSGGSPPGKKYWIIRRTQRRHPSTLNTVMHGPPSSEIQ
jgi:hypothetical protein